MTRFFKIILQLLVIGFFVAGIAFGKGNGDSGAPKAPAAVGNAATATPMETSLGRGDAEAATVQLAPSIPKETIFLGQVNSEIARMERVGGQILTSEQKRQVLTVMINEKLALQAAARDRVTVTDSEINQQFQQLKDNMVQMLGRAPTDNEFAQAIVNETGIEAPAHMQTTDEKRNYIIETFREQIRRQGTVQRYLGVRKESLFKSVKMPTEAEIAALYTSRKSEFVRPDTVRFTMIQVEYGQDGISKSQAKELVDRLNREIGSNASRFDEAVLKSQAPNSGYRAGDGGYLPKNEDAQRLAGDDFVKIAFSLKQGEVSKVIEGLRGYQIIKITETYPRKDLALDDFVEPGNRMTVRDYIGNVLLQEQQQKVLAQATEELINELQAGGSTFQVYEKNLNW